MGGGVNLRVKKVWRFTLAWVNTGEIPTSGRATAQPDPLPPSGVPYPPSGPTFKKSLGVVQLGDSFSKNLCAVWVTVVSPGTSSERARNSVPGGGDGPHRTSLRQLALALHPTNVHATATAKQRVK